MTEKRKAPKKLKAAWVSPEDIGQVPNVVSMLNEMGTILSRVEGGIKKNTLYIETLETRLRYHMELTGLLKRAEQLMASMDTYPMTYLSPTPVLLRQVYADYAKRLAHIRMFLPSGSLIGKIFELRHGPAKNTLEFEIGYAAALEDIIARLDGNYLKKATGGP